MTNYQTKPVILVTGGAGYVGCHSVLQLLESSYRVVVVDNCSNAYVPEEDSNGNIQSLPESLRRVQILAGRQLEAFYKMNLVDQTESLNDVFMRHKIRAVIHFAALKAVSESIQQPLNYYSNNLIGTLNLLNVMKRHGCRDLIFSSSATVYGLPQFLPVTEKHQVGQNVLNPYGRTKYMIEQILEDLCSVPREFSNKMNIPAPWNIIALRYFNPVGAHPSGIIGEHTQDTPSNIMPYISQVAIGKRDKVYIYGEDYDTYDGTGVRDYIHIMDLASGHTHALEYLLSTPAVEDVCEPSYNNGTYKVFNLGTGTGYSVIQLIQTFEYVNKVKIPYEITFRRPGDAGVVYADVRLAAQELGWKAKYGLEDMVRDTYRWQVRFPDGFKSKYSDEKC